MIEIDAEFEKRNREFIERMAGDQRLYDLAVEWMVRSVPHEYAYHFKWMGLPIIQHPCDMIAIQELVYQLRPQTIIETGVARGGSVIFYASLLELLGGDGRVIGVEVGLRPLNRRAITGHPMSRRIDLVDGSSISPAVIDQVRARTAERGGPVLVILDSDHTHDHVLQELDLYGALVTKDSYMIVLDTRIEDVPGSLYPDKPYGPGNNPKTAVLEFMKRSDRFVIDSAIDRKLIFSGAPSGYLRCVR
jgi:cephalosporin hydroxylase